MGSLFSSYLIWRTQVPSTFPPAPGTTSLIILVITTVA
jgi:hypothetical protein